MYVVKADGRKEEFKEEKIIQTCLRAGATPEVAKSIARKARETFREGISTRKLYVFIAEELDKAGNSHLFMLRESVANLDPTTFELYIKKILEANGYRCAWNKMVLGRYVEHQVDLIASKEKTFIVECKRHFNPHRFTGLGICLQVESRLRDIVEGSSVGNNNLKADEAWIVTNTKFSDHAKQYAKGIGIRLTGWKYQEEYSLESLIERKKILPVTLLKTDPSVHRQLIRKKIVTLNDIIKEKPKMPNIKDLIRQSKAILDKL
jgi:hypothetical protein